MKRQPYGQACTQYRQPRHRDLSTSTTPSGCRTSRPPDSLRATVGRSGCTSSDEERLLRPPGFSCPRIRHVRSWASRQRVLGMLRVDARPARPRPEKAIRDVVLRLARARNCPTRCACRCRSSSPTSDRWCGSWAPAQLAGEDVLPGHGGGAREHHVAGRLLQERAAICFHGRLLTSCLRPSAAGAAGDN